MMMHFALGSIMFHIYSKFQNNDDPTGIKSQCWSLPWRWDQTREIDAKTSRVLGIALEPIYTAVPKSGHPKRHHFQRSLLVTISQAPPKEKKAMIYHIYIYIYISLSLSLSSLNSNPSSQVQLARQLGIEMPKCSLFFLPHWVAVILTTQRHCHTRPRRIETGELSTFVFRLHTVAWATNLAPTSKSERNTKSYVFWCVPVQYPVAYQESCKGKATFCQKAVPWAVETVSVSELETLSVHQSVNKWILRSGLMLNFPANHESLILGTPKPKPTLQIFGKSVEIWESPQEVSFLRLVWRAPRHKARNTQSRYRERSGCADMMAKNHVPCQGCQKF